MSIRLNTVRALDRQTELVKQYRALHELHADAQQEMFTGDITQIQCQMNTPGAKSVLPTKCTVPVRLPATRTLSPGDILSAAEFCLSNFKPVAKNIIEHKAFTSNVHLIIHTSAQCKICYFIFFLHWPCFTAMQCTASRITVAHLPLQKD